MRSRTLWKFASKIKSLGTPRIAIVDDEEVYFTPNMLALASAAGFGEIERHFRVDAALLARWIEDPPDIVILDIKGIAEKDVAKDGVGIAEQLQRQTPAYIVVTSAHQYHLKNVHRSFDYVIEARLLTGVDFIQELDSIVADFVKRRRRFVRGAVFRAGRYLMVRASVPELPS